MSFRPLAAYRGSEAVKQHCLDKAKIIAANGRPFPVVGSVFGCAPPELGAMAGFPLWFALVLESLDKTLTPEDYAAQVPALLDSIPAGLRFDLPLRLRLADGFIRNDSFPLELYRNPAGHTLPDGLAGDFIRRIRSAAEVAEENGDEAARSEAMRLHLGEAGAAAAGYAGYCAAADIVQLAVMCGQPDESRSLYRLMLALQRGTVFHGIRLIENYGDTVHRAKALPGRIARQHTEIMITIFSGFAGKREKLLTAEPVPVEAERKKSRTGS